MSPFIIGSLISGAGSLLGGLFQKSSSEKIAGENLDFQQQQFEYQKALNQLQMEREDSTYQRTVNDMRQAGMSPLAMQSTNSAGSLSAGVAPQREQTDYSGILNSLYSITSQFSQLGQVMSGIRRTDAETNFINAQAQKLYQDIQFDSDTYSDRINTVHNNSQEAFIDSRQKWFDYRANSYYGFSSHMPDDLKRHLFSIASGYITGDSLKDETYYNEDNQYNEIYNYEKQLGWDNIQAETNLRNKELDWKDFDKVIGSFGALLRAFSQGL